MLARVSDLELGDLRVFVRVVQRGAFAAAARELKVPTSTVSRTIARLEERIGTRLLHRTPRSVQTTSEGRALYASVSEAVGVLERAAHGFEPATRVPKGTLKLAAPVELATTFLADVLVAFAGRHPLVRVELMVTNRAVDLVREGFDLAIRAVVGRLADSSLVGKKLGELEHGLYASPRYVDAHGVPSTPSELAEHRCIAFRAKDLTRRWTLYDGTSATDIDVRASMSADDFSAIRAAVLAGGGIATIAAQTPEATPGAAPGVASGVWAAIVAMPPPASTAAPPAISARRVRRASEV